MIAKIKLRIAYLQDLKKIVSKLSDYQENPTIKQKTELEVIAAAYGGDMNEVIWSVIDKVKASKTQKMKGRKGKNQKDKNKKSRKNK